MSLLFGDIYEAIRAERIKKGVCEKDIINCVQEKVGGSLSVANVLKTIKVLKKLVDDGVLIKKGKRYMFNTGAKSDNKDKDEDEEEEIDEDEEEDDDDDADEESVNQEQNCENEDEEDDEDEGKNEQISLCHGNDDEDDDDDEEDDDDDDDDDNDDVNHCGGKVYGAISISSPMEASIGKRNSEKDSMWEKSNKEKVIMNAGKENSADESNNDPKKNEKNCLSSDSKNDRHKNTSESNVIESNPGKKSKEGETIAFCVRDFIDSLYRPKSHSSVEETLPRYDDSTQENMNAAESSEEVEKDLKERGRKFPGKRNKVSGCNHRSRSPIKKLKAKIMNLKRDRSEAFRRRTLSNQYYPEPMDADTDKNLEKDKDKDIEIEYESGKDKSPLCLLPPTNSKGDVEKRASTISIKDQNQPETVFPENQIRMAKNNPGAMTSFDIDHVRSSGYEMDDDETGEQTYKRKTDHSDDEGIKYGDKESLCSVCEKTIRGQ